MQMVKLATMAMATRFELVVRGEEDPAWLRAAGEEALAEISRLHGRLSFYSSSSDVTRINRVAYHEPVPVEAGLFRLLVTCQRLHSATRGAFDVTVGPLMRCWGFVSGTVGRPSEEDLRSVMSRVGFHHVHLDESDRTVSLAAGGVEIDLGGVGKGYAIDEAMHILREAGVEHAFLHGGTSSMSAMGDSPDGPRWTVAVSAPVRDSEGHLEDELVAVPVLANRSLAVSDVRGKCFVTEGASVGHVLDPRTGRPVEGVSLSAVESHSATEADALSTALLVASGRERDLLRAELPGIRMLVARGGVAGVRVEYSDFPDVET